LQVRIFDGSRYKVEESIGRDTGGLEHTLTGDRMKFRVSDSKAAKVVMSPAAPFPFWCVGKQVADL
jgi:hypothetical protein